MKEKFIENEDYIEAIESVSEKAVALSPTSPEEAGELFKFLLLEHRRNQNENNEKLAAITANVLDDVRDLHNAVNPEAVKIFTATRTKFNREYKMAS